MGSPNEKRIIGQVKKINKNIIYFSTLFIYLLTLLVHIVLHNIDNGRNYLGLTMVIPLLIVVFYQKIYKKQNIIHTFGISRPTIKTLVFSILFPLLLGLCLMKRMGCRANGID
jgi:hypothetical protein